ncbi:MAG: NADP-dependent malic enzyme [Oscillospiraceae bacterium]|nr:NADP-dependent malic enzyme [Oscillospiraceae bacterium]
MDYMELSLKKHYEWGGKIDYAAKMPIKNREDLSIAYTPGVARPCEVIRDNPEKSFELTSRRNLVAVITDGSAVLGLGDIGPEAAMPVMEGKCVLFKALGGVDALPLCIRSKDTDEFVHAVSLLLGSFGGVNLEDISAPRCFEIERKLKAVSDIPVFHDDQHGTAVVTLAALINALRVVGKDIKNIRVVVCGAGAAGVATTKLLLKMGLGDAVLCDRKGAIFSERGDLNESKAEMALITNKSGIRGSLADAMKGADVFIGVSSPGIVTEEMVRSMAPGAIVFTMSNPTPEIMPELAERAGAAVVGTGRSDYKNQINNVMAFPGIFRGALDVRASDVNDEMKLAAALALAGLVGSELSADYILPEPFDPRVTPAVSSAVAEAAVKSGVARIKR